MKTATPGMIALLATGRFYIADLFTFTLVDGTILRYTSGDGDIKVGTVTYSSTGPRIDRTTAEWSIGLEAGSMDIRIAPQSTDLINGIPFRYALRIGAFDGALVLVQRAVMPTYGDTTNGVINIFDGRVGSLDFDRLGVTVSCNDWRELLDMGEPYRFYQTGCIHTLYDAGCGLLKANFTETKTVIGTVSTQSVQFTSSKAVGYYDLGTLRFTGGQNKGLMRSVKAWDGTTATLTYPFPFTPAEGDAFEIAPGCDKTVDDCTNKFFNILNFAGTPFVPVAENAI